MFGLSTECLDFICNTFLSNLLLGLSVGLPHNRLTIASQLFLILSSNP